MADEKLKDGWDKLEILGKFLGPTIVAVGLGFAGHFVSLSLGGREIDVKIMTLAKGILELDPAKTGADSRKWAKGVLVKYSGVSMGEEVVTRSIGIVQDFTTENKGRIDITVFHCDAGNEPAAQRVAGALPRDKVGQIKVLPWPDNQTPKAAEMKGTTTIFFDPNELEVARIVAAAVGALPAPKLTANVGPPTAWRVSAVVCG